MSTTYTEQLRALEERKLLPVTSDEAAFMRLLGYNIAQWREKRGLLQKDFAQLLGMSQSAFSKIERGESRINVYDLKSCARLLECKIQVLIP